MAKKNKDKKKDAKRGKLTASPADIAFEVAQVARQFRTLTSRTLSDVGLYGGQEGVMTALGEEDGLTAGAIASRLGVKPPTITRTITRMEAQGLLTRKGGEDGRQTTVWLTETGRAKLDSVETSSNTVMDAAFHDLDEKQMRKLLELLQQVSDNLETALSAEG
ncbi:MarR family winged helix-turn-helix transcriptional regulator [Rhizobium sp. C1]|uniref:MarR family winged helix-turn-helix transcriptional regulator n=1 Tax=Rhizobium sp. C1 TaxID=1349799 RepID=UPI001E5ED642|nr:MarR family winged helix-turn-helix transcriptional regulator [Rhizobium sp. C1]MCD2180034.1 MarR family winged helix-turn-helix transcriptional regulator [Rhizobium sp. C1]